MQLIELEKYGIPKRVIDIWQKRQGEALLPVQSKAVRKGLIGRPTGNSRYQSVNMLIAAPTSSGKSFCAEMAAMRALTVRQKVIMLFPLKSLAEQKYRLFNETYSSMGIKCLIVTGDHPENDKAFSSGNYQIAVAIYEKLDMLLTSSMDNLKNIGMVLIDEIQTISEPGRGAILERLLTKIKASVYKPSLIGLSAVINNSIECDNDGYANPTGYAGHAGYAGHTGYASSGEQLAEWMEATLVEESSRPVDLIRGVAAGGKFCYRSFNSHLDGSEPFPGDDPGDNLFDSFIKQIKAAEGSTLIFLKSRMDTVNCAFRLAASVNWGSASQAIKQLEDEEPSFLIRSLCQVMSRGIAFHSSDLTLGQRQIVEQSFANKEIRVIISTTTLAMGVNLPVDTVYLETVKYVSGEYHDQPMLVPVSRAEFDNMTGRAGRLIGNQSNCSGRAVVLAESSFDRDVLWNNYIAGEQQEPMKSAFSGIPLIDWILDMVVSRLADSSGSLVELYRQTLHARLNESEAISAFDFDEAVQLLIDKSFLKYDNVENKETLSPTKLGDVTSKSGLSVREAVYYLRKLKSRRGCPESLAGWVSLALSGPCWSLPPSILSRYELAENEPLKILYRRYDHLLSDAGWLLPESHRNEPLTYRGAASLKAVLLLCEWSSMMPVRRIEERFQIHLGQITYLGETAAHLVLALASLVEVTEQNQTTREQLEKYAFSLRWGMSSNWQEWQKYFKNILNRNDYIALQKAGVEELSQLCNMTVEDIHSVIVNMDKSKIVNDKTDLIKEEVQVRTETTMKDVGLNDGGAVLFSKPELIEIDGGYERERYLIKINGFPVRLTGKSFKYFTKLACARISDGAGWIYKEDIEVGFNQARYLYRMKNELNSGLRMDWQIIENNRLGYYRLNVEPSKIKIDFGNLKDNPDYELQELALNFDTREQSVSVKRFTPSPQNDLYGESRI